ncbi:hypothetical protein [Flavobacterium salmonis]|uniref:Uncharacterized protein n=2 Tax=Flavobacterium TaxID=237 RepID=A0A6V6YSK7_9FLAO|nr:hypothetical protein [Flavobacterium salmonis]OOV20190.1 hypothetical protein BXU10_11400 [Flavobacterium sp. LM4]CAD0002471.1 hypothetical protein FLAT13_01155 [Flavobacterium salmonis]
MYSTTEKEKDFLNQQKLLTTSSLKDFNDRELLEKQTIYLMNIEKSNERIKVNLQFWFYFAIISGVSGLLFLIN